MGVPENTDVLLRRILALEYHRSLVTWLLFVGVELDSAVLLDKFHLNGRWEDANGKRTGRRISDDLTAVPLPAAAWLFMSALMGLLLVARQKKSV